MEAFQMEIAGVPLRVEPLFQSTKEYCRPYLTDKTPEFTVTVTPEDLTFEQKMLDQEADEEGLKRRVFTEPFLERTTIQRKVADRLIGRQILLLHGSTVAVDGEAYLFTAPCRTGKSTHTRLWRELFGERAVMVNDDKPFLQLTDGGVLAYGSPWSGKHGLATNICAPLKGICILSRGAENRIAPMAAEAALAFLRQQLHTPEDPRLCRQALVLLEQLMEATPLWQMACNKDPEAAQVSYAAMRRTK